MAYVIEPREKRTFDFQIKGSKKVYHIPVMSALPVKTLAKARRIQGAGGDEKAEALFDFFLDIFCSESDEAMEKLSAEDFAELFRAYVEASGTDAADAGE